MQHRDPRHLQSAPGSVATRIKRDCREPGRRAVATPRRSDVHQGCRRSRQTRPAIVAATAPVRGSGSVPIGRTTPVAVSRACTVRTAPDASPVVVPPITYTFVPSAATRGAAGPAREGLRGPERCGHRSSRSWPPVAARRSKPPTRNVRATIVAAARSERGPGETDLSQTPSRPVPTRCTTAVSGRVPATEDGRRTRHDSARRGRAREPTAHRRR